MSGQSVISILRDDTDVFAILVYWVILADMQCKERWDGLVPDTNTTCADLGRKCLQLPGMLKAILPILYQKFSSIDRNRCTRGICI